MNVFCRTVMRLALALCLVPAALLTAAPRWISVSSAHFDLYTTASQREAKQALETFEQVRYFFSQVSSARHLPDNRVRVIAFNSEKEFRPYRVSSGAFAYYLRSRERDYIVMQDIQPEHHEAAVHEYTHLIVQHLELRLPIWLNEGIADLYSTLEPRGNRALVGRYLPGRFYTVLHEPWIDWNTVFTVDAKSPYYNQSDKMNVFYSQSYVLAHMLALGPNYRLKFPQFLLAVGNGEATTQALQAVYGKSIPEIDADLHAYVQRNTIAAALFDVKLGKSELEPAIAEPSELQIDLNLADLLTSIQGKDQEALVRLHDLQKRYPDNPDVEESLGYLAWQQNHRDQAQAYFGSAIAHHSQNAQMMYHYAQLAAGPGRGTEDAIAALEQCLAIQPENDEAHLLLAQIALNAQKNALALGALSEIKAVTPDTALRYFTVSAFVRANLHDFDGSRQYATKALAYAHTPGSEGPLRQLLEYLDRTQSKPQASAPSVQLH